MADLDTALLKLHSNLNATETALKHKADAIGFLADKKSNLIMQIELEGQKLAIAKKYLQKYTQKYGQNHQAAISQAEAVHSAVIAIENLQQAYQHTESQLNAAVKANKDYTHELTIWKEKLNSLDETLGTYQLQLNTLETQYEKSGSSIQSVKEAQTLLNNVFDSSKSAVLALDDSLAQLNETANIHRDTLKALKTVVHEANEKLQAFENNLQKSDENLLAYGERISKIGEQMNKNIASPVQKLGTAILKTGMDFETAFAAVRTAFDLTDAGYEKLRQGILSMDIPVDPAAIASVMALGGQLGIASENALAFTKTMIDMSKTAGISGEKAAEEMVRFAEITGMAQNEFDRLGSVILSLSREMGVAASDLLSMGIGIGAAGRSAGMSSVEIMALAGVLTRLGIESQAGKTAVTALFQQLNTAVNSGGKALDDFAALAGTTADVFRKKFQEDAAGAISDLLKELEAVSSSGKNLTDLFLDFGMHQSAADVLTTLANSGDLLSQALENAGSAWETNNTLAEEAGKSYDTTASQLQGLLRDIHVLAIEIADVLIPVFKDIIVKAREIVQGFMAMDQSAREFIVKAGLLAAALGPVISAVGSSITAFSNFKNALDIVTKGTASISPAAANLAVVFGGIKTAAVGAKTALTGLGIALGPVGLALGAAAVTAGVVAAAMNSKKKAAEEAMQAMQSLGDTLSDLMSRMEAVGENADTINSLTAKWHELNQVMADAGSDTETLRQAKEELNMVEEQLILNSNGIISNYDIENGLIEQKIPLLERINELERQNLLLEMERATQGITIESIEQEIAAIEKKEETFREAYARQQERVIALKELELAYQKDLEGLNTTALNTREAFKKYGDELWQLGVYVEHSDDVQRALSRSIKEAEKTVDKTNNTLIENNKQHIALLHSKNQLEIKQQLLTRLETEYETAINSTTERLTEQNSQLFQHTELLNESAAKMKTASTQTEMLEDAYSKLTQGQQLSYKEIENLIDIFPQLAKHIVENSDLTFYNGEVLKDLSEAQRQAAVVAAEKELEKTKAALQGSETRIAILKAEIQAYTRINAAAPDYVMKALVIEEEELNQALQAVAKAEAALQELNNTAVRTADRTGSARSSAAAAAAKEENKAYQEALSNLEKRASLEKLTAAEMIEGYEYILSAFAHTEDEKLALTRKITELQKQEVKRFGEAATEAVKAHYSQQRQEALESLDKFKTAEREKIDIVRENSTNTLEILTREHIERISKIDAEKAAKLEYHRDLIQQEIERIAFVDAQLAKELSARYEILDAKKAELEADQGARRERQEAERLARLEEKIRTAESLEERKAAEKELADYKEEQKLKSKAAEIEAEEKAIAQLIKEADEQVARHLENIGSIQIDQDKLLQDLTNTLTYAEEEVMAFYDRLIENAPQLTAKKLSEGAVEELNALMRAYNPDWQDKGKGFMDFYEEMQQRGNLTGAELTASILYDTAEIEDNYNAIGALISTHTSEAADSVAYMSKEITDILESLKDDAYVLALDTGYGFISGLTDAEPSIMAKARAIANAVAETIAAALQINSPSRITRQLGINTGQGLSMGLGETEGDLRKTAKRLANTVAAEMQYINHIAYGGNLTSSNVSHTYQSNHSGGNVYLTIDKFENKSDSDIHRMLEEAGKIAAGKMAGRGIR